MVWNVLRPPKVTITVGPEVALRRDGDAAALADENTQRMMGAISNLLPLQAREAREPTEAEIRSALPSNYQGDLNAEFDRRPGTD
jgi:hypothetical protein